VKLDWIFGVLVDAVDRGDETDEMTLVRRHTHVDGRPKVQVIAEIMSRVSGRFIAWNTNNVNTVLSTTKS